MNREKVASLLEQVSEQIQLTDFDDKTPEQLLDEVGSPVDGEDPIYVINEAIRLLNEEV